jgi:integrase
MKRDLETLNTKKLELFQALQIFVSLLKVNTAKAYRRDITEYLEGVKSFTLQDTLTYFQGLQMAGYAASSIDRKKAALSRFFQFLLENNHITANPFSTQTFRMLMKKIRQDADLVLCRLSNKPEAHHLKWEEIERMMAVCDEKTLQGRRDKVIVLLGVYEGLRRSEMTALRWHDIKEQVNGRTLLIRGAKGGTEAVDLHDRVMAALQDLKKAYKKAEITTDAVLVCLSNKCHGARLAPVSVNRIVKNLAKRADVKDSQEITAHDLRHTCAVQLLLHGAAIERVSRHLRHKKIQTTMTYLKTLELHQHSAVSFLP